MTVQTRAKARPLFDPPIVRRAIIDSVLKLNPRHQIRNPVMFCVLVGSVLTTALWIQAVVSGDHGEAPASFIFAIAAWLWLTVLFANFPAAIAVRRRKAPADSVRKAPPD